MIGCSDQGPDLNILCGNRNFKIILSCFLSSVLLARKLLKPLEILMIDDSFIQRKHAHLKGVYHGLNSLTSKKAESFSVLGDENFM